MFSLNSFCCLLSHLDTSRIYGFLLDWRGFIFFRYEGCNLPIDSAPFFLRSPLSSESGYGVYRSVDVSPEHRLFCSPRSSLAVSSRSECFRVCAGWSPKLCSIYRRCDGRWSIRWSRGALDDVSEMLLPRIPGYLPELYDLNISIFDDVFIVLRRSKIQYSLLTMITIHLIEIFFFHVSVVVWVDAQILCSLCLGNQAVFQADLRFRSCYLMWHLLFCFRLLWSVVVQGSLEFPAVSASVRDMIGDSGERDIIGWLNSDKNNM